MTPDPSRSAQADAGLDPANYQSLNEDFYATQPWVYIHQRLAFLVLAAGDPERYAQTFQAPLELDRLRLQIDLAEPEAHAPTARQIFVAIEAETLLHHAAETLLRHVQAHAEPDPCPWLRMSRVRGPGAFKRWLGDGIVDASDDELAALCRRVLAYPEDAPPPTPAGGYLRVLARYLRNADSYNAAKHGLAIQGGMQRWTLSIDDQQLLERDGVTLTWLAPWPRSRDDQPPRWHRVSRMLSIEATVALIQTACLLLHSIWRKGRQTHLGEAVELDGLGIEPRELFASFGVRHVVIADQFHALRYEGADQTLTFQIPQDHLDLPSGDGEAGAADGPYGD
jgi:hypothetical protein